jgi:hypothetical protein
MMHGTGWPSTAAIPPRITFKAGNSKRRTGCRLEKRHVDPLRADLFGKGDLAVDQVHQGAGHVVGACGHVDQQRLKAHQVAGNRKRTAHRDPHLRLGKLPGQPGGHGDRRRNPAVGPRIEGLEAEKLRGRAEDRFGDGRNPDASGVLHLGPVGFRLKVVDVDPGHDRRVLVDPIRLGVRGKQQLGVPRDLPRGPPDHGCGMFVNRGGDVHRVSPQLSADPEATGSQATVNRERKAEELLLF